MYIYRQTDNNTRTHTHLVKREVKKKNSFGAKKKKNKHEIKKGVSWIRGRRYSYPRGFIYFILFVKDIEMKAERERVCELFFF